MMSKARREEQHASIREEIKGAARRLMEREGTAGISIRGIGRELDLTAPALYHYYPSREALITDLIVDAFNALAQSLEDNRGSAGGQPAAAQLLRVLLAYRAWALAHPLDFELIYGNPIPGYRAPEEITVPAATRSFVVIGALITRALEGSTLTPRLEYAAIPPEFEAVMQAQADQLSGPGLRLLPLALYLTAVGWPRIHGIIMLELFNHIQPVVGDANAFYRIQIEDMMRSMGILVA
jgi:AcrR family transcriptional regulator